jgi:hypothetical protein
MASGDGEPLLRDGEGCFGNEAKAFFDRIDSRRRSSAICARTVQELRQSEGVLDVALGVNGSEHCLARVEGNGRAARHETYYDHWPVAERTADPRPDRALLRDLAPHDEDQAVIQRDQPAYHLE